MLSYEEANKYLRYDPQSGEIYWRVARPNGGRAQPGKRADYLSGEYRRVTLSCKNYGAHVIAWLLYYKEYPNKNIDHVDRDKTNNKIENLRLCEHWQNCCNKGVQKNNSSGIRGVRYDSKNKRWEAYLTCMGRRVYKSTFATKEKAILARKAAEKRYHGEFAA